MPSAATAAGTAPKGLAPRERHLSPWPDRGALLGRVVVGAVFVFAGVVKGLDPEGFSRQIASYGWLPDGWEGAAAHGLVGLEILLGAALLLGAAPRLAAAGTLGLLGVFLAVTVASWAQGRAGDCGCFGSLVDRGPGEVVAEDLILAALLVPTFLAGGHARRLNRWRVAGALLAAGMGVALAAVSPGLPVDDLVTRLVPGATLEDLGMDALVPRHGEVLVALLSIQAPGPGPGVVEALNQAARDLPEIRVVAFADADPDARAVFGWTQGAGFPLEELSGETLGRLARRLPRFALLREGAVVAVWNDSPPAPDQVRAAAGG